MARLKTVHHIVLASPGDVRQERNEVESVVQELNQLYKSTAIGLVLYRWEDDAMPGIALQSIQNELIEPGLRIEEADIVIGIFHRRIGLGGAVQEMRKAGETWRTKGRPRVLLYFRDPGRVDLESLDERSLEQLRAVKEYRRECQQSNILYTEFGTTAQLAKDVRKHLHDHLEKNTVILPVLPTQGGYQQFFTVDDAMQRAAEKSRCIRAETKQVRLVANVGRSFFYKDGGRFYGDVVRLLDNGGRFRLLAQNPWSFTGYFVALAERDTEGAPPDDPAPPRGASGNSAVQLVADSTSYRESFLPSTHEMCRLQRCYPHLLECRICDADLPATCLLTESHGFFEPYLAVDTQHRYQKSMNTFEVQFGADCHLHAALGKWFERIWNLSLSLVDFVKGSEALKRRFRRRFDDWVPMCGAQPVTNCQSPIVDLTPEQARPLSRKTRGLREGAKRREKQIHPHHDHPRVRPAQTP